MLELNLEKIDKEKEPNHYKLVKYLINYCVDNKLVIEDIKGFPIEGNVTQEQVFGSFYDLLTGKPEPHPMYLFKKGPNLSKDRFYWSTDIEAVAEYDRQHPV